MSDTKKCTKCGRELLLDQFHRKRFKDGVIGHQTYCKDCKREWRRANIEGARAAGARHYRNNPEKANLWRKNNPKKAREASARWKKNNPEKYRVMMVDYRRVRKVADPCFKLITNIRSGMSSALRGRRKAYCTVALLGCSIEYLRNYLEGQFQPGMSWGNYGVHGWHIDHIIPLSYFDFTDSEQQKRAWHYTNLQPLWAEDNLYKRAKVEERQLILL